MSFEKAMEALKGVEGGEELAKDVNDRLSKVNAEAKALRDRAKKAEETADRFVKVSETLRENGFDVDSDLTEQFKSIKEKTSTADANSQELKKLTTEFAKLKKDYEESAAKNVELENKQKRSKIKDSLFTSFNDQILNGKKALDYGIDKGIFYLNDDGKLAYKSNSGEEITESIMDAYIKDNPDEVRNVARPGAESSPKGGAPEGKITREALLKMTNDEYKALSDEQRAQINNSL